MKTDEQLMEIYLDGDLQAFEELYRRYKNRVYGFLAKKVDSSQQDDVFQLVFMKLHEKKHLFKSEYRFSPWFFTLIKNTIIDHYRKNRVKHEELTIDPVYEDQDETSTEEISSLHLDENQQRLLYLKFVEGYGYKELEEEFKTSAATLRKRVSRLITNLRNLRPRGSHE